MRKILRRSSSLVLAGLFLLNGHCGLLSQRVLADPPTPDSLKFRGDNKRTYSLRYKTQGEKNIPWIIGAGQESVAYMCQRDDGKICVVKIRGSSDRFDIDAVVERSRESYKPIEVFDQEIDDSTLPRRSIKAASIRKSNVRSKASDSSDVFLDISEERKVSGSSEKDIPDGGTSTSSKLIVKQLSFEDTSEDEDEGSDEDLDALIVDDEYELHGTSSRRNSSFPAGARKSLPSPIGISPDDDLDELIGDDEDELYCTSSRRNSSFPAGAQKSLPIPRDKEKSSLLSRMEEMDSSDEEDASETPKRHCVKRIKASEGNSSLLSRMEEMDSSDEKGTSEKPPKMRCVRPNFYDDDDLSDRSKVSTSVCGSSDESLSSPDSGLISKGGSPVETSSCASVNASPDSGSSSSVTLDEDVVLRSEAVKRLLVRHRGKIPNLVEIESFNPHIEKAYVANLESYIETSEDKRNHITKAKATEDQVKTWVGNILDALVRLSELRICHQDIKPDNILLDEKGQAILGDVGAMRTLDEVTNRRTSVEGYMAPEVCNESMHGLNLRDRADVFSLAITALELLTGSKVTSPYKTIMQNILDDKYLMWDGRPLSDGWKIFLWKCLAPTPEKRLTASQAKVVLDNLVVADSLTFYEAKKVLEQLVDNEQKELVKIKEIFGKLFTDKSLTEDDKKALFYSFISSEKLVLKEKEALYDLWFLQRKLTPEYKKALLNCSSDEELMLFDEIFQNLFSGKTLNLNEKKFLLKHFVEHKRFMPVMEENLLKSSFVSKGIAQDQIDGLFGELHLSTTRLFDDLMKHLELDLADEQEAFDE